MFLLKRLEVACPLGRGFPEITLNSSQNSHCFTNFTVFVIPESVLTFIK